MNIKKSKETPMTDEDLISLLKTTAGDLNGFSPLRDNLEALIENGTLEVGRRLPPERLLAESLGMSRLAVRQALEALAIRGVVERRHGSGTYVAPSLIEGNLHLLRGFSEELRSHHRSVSTRILQFGYCSPTPAVQDALEIGPDALATVKLVRVRSIDGTPSTHETSWLPSRLAEHLLGRDLSNESLFRLLAETKGVVPDHATEKLHCALLDRFEAEELETQEGSPAFRVNRVTYDPNGSPIEYVETLLRGDRYFYATTLEATHRLPKADERLSRFETLSTDSL